MADVLHITDPLITGEDLRRQHQDQEEVRFDPKTVITPTAWDYIRQHKLRVSRGEAVLNEPAPAAQRTAAQPVAIGQTHEEPQIKEVAPPQMVQEGRCDYPDQPYGCKEDEFGSGFVEPSSCHDCDVHQQQREGEGSYDCDGCNRYETALAAGQVDDIEALVRQITDLVMEQLGKA